MAQAIPDIDIYTYVCMYVCICIKDSFLPAYEENIKVKNIKYLERTRRYLIRLLFVSLNLIDSRSGFPKIFAYL